MENIKVPTAEEWLKQIYNVNSSREVALGGKSLTDKLIEFAKLHVNAALKEALESIPCLGSSSDIPTYEEVEEAVLNCYPENLIQ